MIGVFDSGIGGLTVAKAIRERLPDHDLLYFGDTARTPYGSKSRETVIRYALQDTEFLLNMGAKVIVMACNTVSSLAADAVTQAFDAPVFEVVTPAVETALRATKKGRFGVIGTRATVNSGIYEAKITALRTDAKVYSYPCPLLVPLVEEGWLKKPETRMIVKKYLIPLKVRQIDTLILGCTHYPVLKPIIQQKAGKRVSVVDSSLAVAENLAAFLENRPDIAGQIPKNGDARFFVSDVTEHSLKTAKAILRRNLRLEAAGVGRCD